MKQKYVLSFPSIAIEEPVTYNLVKKFDIKINILRAEITAGEEGNLLIDMESDELNLKKGITYLTEQNIKVEPFVKQISFKQELCVHCGGCTSVCFAGALFMDKITWELQFKGSKCVACGLCIKACPLNLFTLQF
jgi:L-aspartate semialdehyde sulfurtransferase ferredoxin